MRDGRGRGLAARLFPARLFSMRFDDRLDTGLRCIAHFGLQFRSTGLCRRRHAVTASLRHSSLPMATAVSAMRLEKPHSLSYQDITRTKVPSMTLVWSIWNVDEAGL